MFPYWDSLEDLGAYKDHLDRVQFWVVIIGGVLSIAIAALWTVYLSKISGRLAELQIAADADRSIDVDAMAAELQEYAGLTALISYDDDKETKQFAGQVTRMFEKAGWLIKIEEFQRYSIDETYFGKPPLEGIAFGGPKGGGWDDAKANLARNSLTELFQKHGLIANPPGAMQPSDGPTIVRVVIGPKPKRATQGQKPKD